MYWYGPHMGGWGWAVGLGSLVFWALLAVAAVALVLAFTRGWRPGGAYHGYASRPGSYGPPGGAAGGPSSPEQILAERFARGEIDEQEFRQRMAALRVEAPNPGPAGKPS